MKRTIGFVIACLLLVPSGLMAGQQGKKTHELKTFQEKLSYSMGLDVGAYFKGTAQFRRDGCGTERVFPKNEGSSGKEP